MWRSLTITLFIIILAQAANALPISNEKINSNVQTIQLEKSKSSLSKSSLLVSPLFSDDEKNDLFKLPGNIRANASVFSAEIQVKPNYILEIEFFATKLTAGLFKNLANPPVVISWYEQLGCKTRSSRISGWKDGILSIHLL